MRKPLVSRIAEHLRDCAWIGLMAAVAIPTLVLAQVSGPRFRADGWNADEYGRAEGYPIGKRGQSENAKFLVGAYSRGETLDRTHVIDAPATASRLGRVAKEPSISFVHAYSAQSLDDYLDQQPITGLLIARDNRILVERYQYDRSDLDHFTSQSMAKTITGLLIGIAVDERHIRSIEEPAETYAPALRGSEFGRTPIKALLQMSSGIKFAHKIIETGAAEDAAMLNRLRRQSVAEAVMQFNERIAPPNTRFNYTSAESLVLGLVLAGAVGRPVGEYAHERLWVPLGAESHATWTIDKSGQELTSCCFSARLRDWARLGLMLAHDGAWQGRQIVPREWLQAATTVAPADAHLRPGAAQRESGYGYQTWLLPDRGRMFALRGFRGQTVLVDPQTKTVMVQTSVAPVGHQLPTLSLWRGVLQSLR